MSYPFPDDLLSPLTIPEQLTASATEIAVDQYNEIIKWSAQVANPKLMFATVYAKIEELLRNNKKLREKLDDNLLILKGSALGKKINSGDDFKQKDEIAIKLNQCQRLIKICEDFNAKLTAILQNPKTTPEIVVNRVKNNAINYIYSSFNNYEVLSALILFARVAHFHPKIYKFVEGETEIVSFLGKQVAEIFVPRNPSSGNALLDNLYQLPQLLHSWPAQIIGKMFYIRYTVTPSSTDTMERKFAHFKVAAENYNHLGAAIESEIKPKLFELRTQKVSHEFVEQLFNRARRLAYYNGEPGLILLALVCKELAIKFCDKPRSQLFFDAAAQVYVRVAERLHDFSRSDRNAVIIKSALKDYGLNQFAIEFPDWKQLSITLQSQQRNWQDFAGAIDKAAKRIAKPLVTAMAEKLQWWQMQKVAEDLSATNANIKK
jgi:hypothetical protein